MKDIEGRAEELKMNEAIKIWSESGNEINSNEKIAGSVGKKKIRIIQIKFQEEKAKDIRNRETVHIQWNIPAVGFTNCWYPDGQHQRIFGADWQKFRKTMLAVSAPVYCLYDENGSNYYTVALSDCIHEVRWTTGIHEEDGTFLFHLEIRNAPQQVQLYINEEKLVYGDVLRQVEDWWEKECDFRQAEIPESAKYPFYSTWYSYHQELSQEQLEEECRLVAACGFKGVIVDDGWQTEDKRRGYAFCGDWEIAVQKFPNFLKHIRSVQKLGIKYMLWVSVPFIGKHSKAWEKFHEKLLEYQEYMQAGVVDIRYPEVRSYLIEEYCGLVRKYQLDGLKMDFLDEFYEREQNIGWKEGMDFDDVQEALECLLEEMTERFHKYKEDFLIEFRQKYIGPGMRRYANILRVDDCPLSGMSNRIGIADLRMLSGKTAVHSDMVMWNMEESKENVARQLVNNLFGVLQLSVKLKKCSVEQKQVIRNYLEFVTKNKDILLEKPLYGRGLQQLYPMLWAGTEEKGIVAIYLEGQAFCIPKKWKETVVVNGTGSEEIFIKTEQDRVEISYFDCMGNQMGREEKRGGVMEINILKGGRAEIYKI